MWESDLPEFPAMMLIGTKRIPGRCPTSSHARRSNNNRTGGGPREHSSWIENPLFRDAGLTQKSSVGVGVNAKRNGAFYDARRKHRVGRGGKEGEREGVRED